MWMLAFVPDSLLEMVVNGVLLFGAISTFLLLFVINRILRWLPWLAPYYTILQGIAVIILGAGIFFKGSYSTEASWRARVAEAQAKAAKAEELAREANAALEAEKAKKVQYIRGRTEYINQYIDREIVKYDTKFAPGGICEIPKEFIEAHNKAAEAPKK